ncbi:MAG TPA: hypothetical protein PK054_10795 [Anaerohalosphaeraceae bacterium]|nr:hypothetical protein [Anaerohalosphaeraceae bacterium]
MDLSKRTTFEAFPPNRSAETSKNSSCLLSLALSEKAFRGRNTFDFQMEFKLRSQIDVKGKYTEYTPLSQGKKYPFGPIIKPKQGPEYRFLERTLPILTSVFATGFLAAFPSASGRTREPQASLPATQKMLQNTLYKRRLIGAIFFLSETSFFPLSNMLNIG